MEVIKEALTFDDVLLVPKYSSVLPSETNLHTDLGYNLKLKIPFLSSAMDTVTESDMGIAIAQRGGLGIIHRNLSIEEQCNEIKKVKKKNLLVGAAVGAGDQDLIRTKSIIDSGVDLIVIDTAHGHSKKVIKIGCDYSHLWDDFQYYNLDDVKFDCKNTIKRFLEKLPNYGIS